MNNDLIEELYNKIDNLEKINSEQALEIARLNNELELNDIEYNTNITWWQNRFNAVERDNRELKNKIKNKIKDLEENNNGDDYSLINVINILKNLLGDKE